ncbi:MAG: anti-sigma factor [Candidatus Eremiobacteraeota bacterium]|nr:anti-sigma factor [Candidatus Eremiobacteraeota bacterium]MBC5804071.1 anti-sigma factor [Candidatus Eremiobacteraeota bacterium]MBC5821646.1 anti-sigma factor [Candidatus Eremiobacteraeota bacterium]
MNLHDDAFLDEIACLALGVLPEAEAQTAALHVGSCESCRALYAELRPAADLIGYAAQEPLGSDEVGAARRKRRIMASVRAPLHAPQAAAARRRAYLPWAATAAAILIAAGFGIQNANLRNDYDRAARVAQQSSAQRTDFERNVLGLLGPHAKRYAIHNGVVIAHDGRLYVALHQLPPPPDGKVYQTWTLANGKKTMTPGGTFVPNRDGIAFIELAVSAYDVAAVAVSVEPAGGSRAPTSKPTFVRKLT